MTTYLQTEHYSPKPSVQTISNAMDVGSPSNFARMQDLYGFTWNNMSNDNLIYKKAIRTLGKDKSHLATKFANDYQV